MTTDVVILVPGTMGSVLNDEAGNVWPGEPSDWIGGYGKLDRLKAPALKPIDILRSMKIFGVKVLSMYDRLVESLGDCGFKENITPQTLYVCPYDWRVSLANSIPSLTDVIQRAVDDHGGDLRIHLVAHSLGGLLCRYYLESGDYDAEPGFTKVEQLLLLGVPHLGLPLMITLARGDLDYVFLSKSQIREVLNHDGLPFAYFMLPHTSARMVWDTAATEPWEPFDVLPAAQAASLGLTSTANAATATIDRQKLAAGSRPTGVRYFSFVGTRRETYSCALVDAQGSTPYPVERVERPDGGDGTVPVWSAWLEGEQGRAVGGTHSVIFRDVTVRRGIATLLGCPPAVIDAIGLDEFQLDLSELVFGPGDPLGIALTPPEPRKELKGTLTFFQETLNKDGKLDEPRHYRSETIEYRGHPIERLQFRLDAPVEPGAYRIEFSLAPRDGEAEGETVEGRFIVQRRA